MALLISFVIGLQVLHSLAHPARPPPASQLSSPPCNSSVIKTTAEEALDRINADRKEGYVFGLQRIFDVRELPQGPDSSILYLTLDVLETSCHVLSRKSWKNCESRPQHETVYGQCKATLRITRSGEFSFLYNYDCLLRPLSSVAIARLCPDCPTPGDPMETKFQEAAAETLAKFNAENNHRHYFALLNVTKASSQWVVGPAKFVEFTIQETSCSKSKSVSEISTCPFLPPETAETGLCKGSVVASQIEHRTFVTVNCVFFLPQGPDTTEQTPPSGPQSGQQGQHSEEGSHEGDRHHHQRGKGHRHHHHQGGHPNNKHHPKHHGDHSRGHQEAQPPHPHPVDQEKTVGRVVILPPSTEHVSLHSLPEIGAEHLDGKPVPPPQVQEPKFTPSLDAPVETHPPQKPEHPGLRKPGRPGLGKPTRPSLGEPSRLSIPPYPAGFSASDTCPGESTINILGLDLPERPVVKATPLDKSSLAE
ncbi:fetuin-B [Pogona vitticeps]